MAEITATFPTLTFGQRGIQLRDNFVQTQEEGQDTLSGPWAAAATLFKEEANAVKNEINTVINASQASANASAASAAAAATSAATSTTKANESSASAASALASKIAIDAKVIPVEATYNCAYIDAALNSRDLENFLNFKF